MAHPLVNVSVLQLHKSGADGSDVALLIGKGHSARPFGVFKLRVGVDTCVAHAAIQAIHDHGQLDCGKVQDRGLEKGQGVNGTMKS